MTTFGFAPVRASATLVAMGAAPNWPVQIHAADWQQAAILALWNAELLAAQAGVVPWIRLEDGTRGVANVGAARAVIEESDADPGVKALYLAVHGAVRVTHAHLEAASSGTPELLMAALGGFDDDEEALGIIPIAVYIVIAVVAMAAVVAAAWYAGQRVETDGRNLRQTSELASLTSLAQTQLATTGKIDPLLYEQFGRLADAEKSASNIGVGVAIGAGSVVAIAAAAAWWWKRRSA